MRLAPGVCGGQPRRERRGEPADQVLGQRAPVRGERRRQRQYRGVRDGVPGQSGLGAL
ncbi:hypothetical protein ACGFX2_22360 [Streptomyces goshikiensis]|uniref:hypothetical protein n=1 Tax=Streptomyces goshikiensis TaxID=1942 RepID=UPI00370F83D0